MPVAAERPYYHGTLLTRAIDALVRGDALRPLHPEGTGRRFARSAVGVCYLTPDFPLAVRYAGMTGRDDWPDEFDCAVSERSHVFAFDLAGVEAVPDEDELGWAVSFAADVRAGKRAVGRCVGEVSANYAFSEVLMHDAEAVAWLGEESRRVLSGGRFDALLARELSWRAADQTAAGKRLRQQADPALMQRLIGMGVSIGIREPVVATAGWAFSRRGRYPQAPEEMEAVAGAWANPGGLRR